MENRQQQILSEIQEMMSSIRAQLEKLDTKMAEYQSIVGEGDADPIDLDIDSAGLPAAVAGGLSEVATDDDLPEEILPEDFAQSEPLLDIVEEPVTEEVVSDMEPVVTEPEADETTVVIETPVEETQVVETPVEGTQVVETPVEEATVVEDVQVEPELESPVEEAPLFSEPTALFEAAQTASKNRKAVIDVMENKQAWRTAIPGLPVKDILSAISLNDRVQYINSLFGGNAIEFQNARQAINSMETLDQVVEYVTTTYDWNMDSQLVYRFMMAVRRKVR